jgi:hypothetical protein
MLTPAAAEMVRLEISGDRFGHGWLFADVDGSCAVATAAHVVEVAGALTAATVVTADDRRLATRIPVQPDPDVDIAFLPVVAPGEDCTLSRLGPDNLAATLARSREAELDTTSTSGEEVRVPVRLVHRAIDEQRGLVFTILPQNGREQFSEGMSGSPVIFEGINLGLIRAIDNDGFGIVVRFDLIKRLYRDRNVEGSDSAAAAAAPLVTNMRLALDRGEAQVTAETVDALFAGEGTLAVNMPERVAELVIGLPATRQITGVVLDVHGANEDVPWTLQVESTIETVGGPGRFAIGRSCRIDELPATIECLLAPRTADYLKLRLISTSPTTAIISRIIVR